MFSLQRVIWQLMVWKNLHLIQLKFYIVRKERFPSIYEKPSTNIEITYLKSKVSRERTVLISADDLEIICWEKTVSDKFTWIIEGQYNILLLPLYLEAENLQNESVISRDTDSTLVIYLLIGP